MLYQDTLTGTLHEVPDSQVGWGLAEDPYGVGEGQMLYDGLGNPLGWGFLKKLVKRAAPFVATSMLGPYGGIIKAALPMVRKALTPVAASTAASLRQQAMRQFAPVAPVAPVVAPVVADTPGVAGWFGEVPAPTPAMQMPVAPMMPFAPVAQQLAPGRRPLPAGWRRPPVPYTGPRPRRVYLRCSAWPGPRGLVPVNAAAAMPPAPPVIAPAVVPGPVRYRGRRRR